MSPVQSWPISIGYFVGLSAVALTVLAHPARADEAYLCGPDNVIYVSAADLPKMKRTNACIAAYYGLTVEASAPLEAPSKPKKTAVVQPFAKPTSKKSAQIALKPMSAPEPLRANDAVVRQAALAPPLTSSGTDYRNVRILNAANPSDAVYRHTK